MFTQSHSPRIVATLVALVAVSVAAPTFAKRPSKRAKAAAAKAAAEKAAADAAAAKAAEEAAAAEAAAAEAAKPPPPPDPGHVNLSSDATGLVAEVAGALHGLKEGDNKVQLMPGDYDIVVRDGAKKEIARLKVRVESNKVALLTVVTKGKLVVTAGADTGVQVDGKAVAAKDGKAETTVGAGKHSVVITQPGMVGRKGEIDVIAGKTHSITATLKPYDAGSKPAAWAGVLGGGALILTAVLLESFAEPTAVGGDATRWALVGVGMAGFVGGTIMMKGILEREANPPVEPGKLDTKVSALDKTVGIKIAGRF